MSSQSTSATADLVCLHCSPARTVLLQRGTSGAPDVVRKIYVSGSMTEAEHEVAMGQAAAGIGVVTYRAAQLDSQSNRPSVTLDYRRGDNLDTLVARRGALPAADAVCIVRSVATTLARLHELSATDMPHGLCHGDIKPQNILLVHENHKDASVECPAPDTSLADTLLLDFEHAIAIGTQPSVTGEQPFTGGTHAYSPPEALRGEQPTAAFDVFGLGATLAFLLDGGIGRRVPRHPRVESLVLACCATDASERPTAAELAARCERLAHVLRDDACEQNLHDWATGTCKGEPTDDSDARAVMWTHRQRILQRLPTLLQAPPTSPDDPEDLQRELDLALRVLARFPRNVSLLARRQQLLEAIRKLLCGAAATVRKQNKAEQFEDALRWLRTTDTLLAAALSVAGGLATVTRLDKGVAPGALQRAPVEFLQLLVTQTEGAEQELRRHADQISAAELTLDLTSAENAIDAMAANYGGTSKTVAERRDQLHRLGFYLDRIARAESKVERVGPLWDPIALQPLRALVTGAATALETFRREPSGSGAVGLRSLQVTLTNIAEEFPHLTQVEPALSALSSALLHLTDQAWQQLDDAELRLNVVPVPVRPLQLALGRLDTFRMLEAFVDRPEHPRSELLDGIERLRLGLEQARSARDRLAENAEHALARGHWTTGLFDMERAVERLHPGDEAEHGEAERLRERLQDARRTKKEIESALRRNVELTANYAALEDDPRSTADARMRVLQDRRDCLIFLGLHVPNDRVELYRKDLRSVETQLAVERAADAEQRLNALDDPLQRLRLARSTVELLSANTPSSGGVEQPGRLVRLQEHWRTVTAQCLRTVDAQTDEQQHRQRHRKRTMAIAVIAFVVTTTAIGFAVKPWLFPTPVLAAPK